MELLIDQVVVTDKEVEIRYVVPTSPDGPHHPFCHLRTDYLEQLPRVADSLERGSVVVIEEDRLRVRALPIGGGTGR